MFESTSCTIKTFHETFIDKYKTFSSVEFMSLELFEEWLISWMVSFRIEFRQQCSICLTHPEIVSCHRHTFSLDYNTTIIEPGTSLLKNQQSSTIEDTSPKTGGSSEKDPHQSLKSLRKMKSKKKKSSENNTIERNEASLLKNDISPLKNYVFPQSKDTSTHKESHHSKSQLTSSQRQFFSYDCDSIDRDNQIEAQDDLKYFIHKFTNDLSDFKSPFFGRSEDERNLNLQLIVPEQCMSTIFGFIQGRWRPQTCRLLVPVLKACAEEQALNSIINYRFIGKMKCLVNLIYSQRNPTKQKKILMDNFSEDLPDIYRLYSIAREDTIEYVEINTFIGYIVDRIEKDHFADAEIQRIETQKYNPETQKAAYYFSQKCYNISYDFKYIRSNCRDTKQIAPNTTSCYVFYDPRHYGHCYGLQLVSSQDDKEPFLPLSKYMTTAPKEIFCEDANSLEDYALQKDPYFYRNTRFFDNLHKDSCPMSHYNSSRIQSLAHLTNTISDEFKNYMDRILLSIAQIKRKHLVFYLQFFIQRWNEKRRQNYKKELKVMGSLR